MCILRSTLLLIGLTGLGCVATGGCASTPPLKMATVPSTINPSLSMVRLDPSAKVIDISRRIEFQTDKAILLLSSHPVLDQVADVLKQSPQVYRVEVQGHTDITGSSEHNDELSQRRAMAVCGYLEMRGIDAERLVPKGYGSSRPIADNTTIAGRQKNRRVEFHVIDFGEKGAQSRQVRARLEDSDD